MLFLGAGVSSGFGLPEWKLLVARILGRDGDAQFLSALSGMSDKDMAKLINDVDDGSDTYVRKVHDALYEGAPDDLADLLSRSPLLLAVAALLTGSCRGRINTIITYNYDDLLMQYLRRLGYKVCVRKEPSDFSTWADVEINYVHGYLPQFSDDRSNACDLILSEKSYRDRRANIDKGWSSYVVHGLYSKNGLFIGLSGEDGSILDILDRAQKEITRTIDYTGYWLMTQSAYDRNASEIIRFGMCPIPLAVEEFPKFVFNVCQKAMYSDATL